jgi:hypothetical protein
MIEMSVWTYFVSVQLSALIGGLCGFYSTGRFGEGIFAGLLLGPLGWWIVGSAHSRKHESPFVIRMIHRNSFPSVHTPLACPLASTSQVLHPSPLPVTESSPVIPPITPPVAPPVPITPPVPVTPNTWTDDVVLQQLDKFAIQKLSHSSANGESTPTAQPAA